MKIRTAKELAKDRERKKVKYAAMSEEEREVIRQRSRAWREKNADKFKATCAAYRKKFTPEQKAKRRDDARAAYHATSVEDRKAIQRIKFAKSKEQKRAYRKRPEVADRLRRQGRTPEHRAWARAYYWKNPEKHRAHARKQHHAAKIRNYFQPEIEWKCTSCKAPTRHETGICKECRRVKCKVCTKDLVQNFIGQRIHENCRDKREQVALYSLPY